MINKHETRGAEPTLAPSAGHRRRRISCLGAAAGLVAVVGCSVQEAYEVGDDVRSLSQSVESSGGLDDELGSSTPQERIDKLAAPRQPLNVIYSARVGEDGSAVDVGEQLIPGLEAKEQTPGVPAAFQGVDLPPDEQRLSSGLAQDLEKLAKAEIPTSEVRVVVTFLEDVAMPRFPDPLEGESKDSESNREAFSRASQLVSAIQALRDPGYDKKAKELSSLTGAKDFTRFWLINGLAFRVPLDSVPKLLARKDVQYVEYEQTDDAPPSDDIVDGRAIIQSDPYFSFTGNWIGLLDTGVRSSHTLFSSPSNLAFQRDCVNGTASSCSSGTGLNPDDDCWNHGTASASIVSGNGNLGNDSRGVTPIALDSFKVYTCAGYNSAAGVRGFEAAVSVLDRVVIGEIQSSTSHLGSTSTAANAAYDAGSVVVAAAGNFGPTAGSVRSPGNAHRALAVGAVDVETEALESYSGRGPTSDGRTKPDILAPTNTRAASTVSSTALQTFGGTSGATPYASGAAALARNFMRGTSSTIDPGLVNAYVIVSGHFAAAYSNSLGGGIIALPINSHVWWGAVSVGNGQNIDIPVSASPTSGVTAAIWWPDPTSSPHNRVSLRLYRPDSVNAFSNVADGVWQKAGWASTLSGTWTARVRGESVSGSQTVYYVIHAD